MGMPIFGPGKLGTRFTNPNRICYNVNLSQASTCQTVLCNECCTGYWMAETIMETRCG